jgi:predicted N-acetyltransferase YhbS
MNSDMAAIDTKGRRQAWVEWGSRREDMAGYHVIVAELDGHIIGSDILDERSTIVGIGPITVGPAVQNRTIGRQLMPWARATPSSRC